MFYNCSYLRYVLHITLYEQVFSKKFAFDIQKAPKLYTSCFIYQTCILSEFILVKNHLFLKIVL